MLVYIGVLNRDLILQYLTRQVTGEQIFIISYFFRFEVEIFANTFLICSSQMKSGHLLNRSKRRFQNISQPMQQLRKQTDFLLLKLNKFHHNNFYTWTARVNPHTLDQFTPSHARCAENCGSALTNR